MSSTVFILSCLFTVVSTSYGLSSIASLKNDKLVILGLGRTGSVVAQLANEQKIFQGGIVGTTSRYQPEADGILRVTRPADLLPTASTHLADATHLLCTIPADGDESLLQVYEEISQNMPKHSWVGVLSTTGVYGNHDGAWVDEDSECRSNEPSTKLYIEMEDHWKHVCQKHSHTCRIFRCAGIYGNTRSALHTVWKQGFRRPGVARQPDVRTNRVHERDIARAVLASMNQHSIDNQSPGFRLYNLADDEPEMRRVVMEYATAKLRKNVSIPPDPKEPYGRAWTRERMTRRGVDSKLVSNARMKQELLCEEGLDFPTYREGLADIIQCNKDQWKEESWTRVQGG